ncbi:MAG: rRNA pseudouridine synthase [Bacteroidetes bacterium]|nr:MAG: rRNA pseudouridine synthase [Bacteroidota bacterium]
MEQVEEQGKVVLQETVRINRFLAMAGVSSRRAAEELVRSGEVEVNGTVVTDLATKVTPYKDTVTVSGKNVSAAQKFIYVLLHKPKDVITTVSDEKDRRTVMDLVSVRERIYPVGRLDRNTSGVLLLTNDGPLAARLMHPSNEVVKSYHVSLDKTLDNAHAEKLANGVHLEDGKTAPCQLDIVPGTKSREVVIHIHEGKNRQVRRMFESLGYEVEKLHRTVYAGLTLSGLGRGRWRFLTDRELRSLRRAAGITAE